MNIFKIPTLDRRTKDLNKTTVIGIIDASGSMKEHWIWVAKFWNLLSKGDQCFTFTFDTKVKEIPSNKLEDNLMFYGGGGTKLPEVFISMEDKLNQVPQTHAINIIFISDGQDNYEKTLEARINKLSGGKNRYINFLCLGIKQEFPTFVAMRLRQLYHTGDPSVPALFLIEYPSEKAFFNKFEAIKGYLSSKPQVKVDPMARSFPWSEYNDKFFQESWVICDSEKIMIEDKAYIISLENIKLNEIVDLLRAWVQELHFLSLNDKNHSIDCALVAMKFSRILIENYRKVLGVEIEGNMEIETSFFSQKALNVYLKSNSLRIKWFLKEIEQISQGNPPSSEDEYKAAKRIALGTLTGKDNQKVLALKNLTKPVFESIKEEFKETFRKNKIDFSKASKQEPSFLSLQNQKEVFAEPNLLGGLEYCYNYMQLIRSFPIIGYAIKIKRSTGSDLNPWLIEVRFIALQHKVIESTYLYEKDMNLELKNINGKNEEINSILPLFDESDGDLFPLLNSRLYRLLMTYMVTKNHDIYHDTAYLSLLAHSMIFFVKNFKEIEWKKDILIKIQTTVNNTYGKDPVFLNFQTLLQQNTLKALDFFQTTFKRLIELPELLIHIFAMSFSLGVQKTKNLMECFFIEYLHRLFVANGQTLLPFIKTHETALAIERLRPLALKSLYPSNLKKQLGLYLGESLTVGTGKLVLEPKVLYSDDNRLPLQIVEKVSEFICGWKPCEDQYLVYLNHIAKYPNNYDRFGNLPNREDDQVRQEIIKTLLNSNAIANLVNKPLVLRELIQEFKTNFAKTHFNVKPLSKDQLIIEAGKRNIDLNALIFKPASDLPNNACLATECPHFLIPIGQDGLRKHMSSWGGKFPKGFHAKVRANIHKDSEEIFKILNEQGLDPKKYKVTKEFVIDYINEIKSVCKGL